MAILPAARRHHRSRLRYALGLLALAGTVGMLLILARHPTFSATELSAPVPAPEITVMDAGPGPDPLRDVPAPAPAEGVGLSGRPAVAGQPVDVAGQAGTQAGSGAGTGGDPVFEAHRVPGGRTTHPDDVGRSLFWSGLLGLVISLAGLGLVGARRRRW
ncbi:hypothetical protein [Micromonospora sp. DT233]|uniref:hypothetical protein n=1 Tax=Micromonospora sp. DT233 TaxID=3393432 RepID=UPI003CF0AC95